MSNVLVIDDSAENRRLFARIMTHRGFEVQFAVDGQQAITLLDGYAPDLLILDINMPNVSGFGVLDWLRKSDRHKDTKVIIVTGNSVADRFPESDMADLFLQKPINTRDLGDMAVRLLAKVPNS